MFDPDGVRRKSDDLTRVLMVPKWNYYGVYLNGEIISLGSTFGHFDFWISHFDILQTHSHMGHDCLRLILEIIPHQRPLYADIPDKYRGFQNFLKKHGFYDGGHTSEIFTKYGIDYHYTRMILDH